MLVVGKIRPAAKLAVAFFALVSAWWLLLFATNNLTEQNKNLWAASYGLICLWGAYRGLVHSRRWGGLRSVMGQALFVLSLGLLAQEFGQLVFSFYNVFLGVAVPYPSIADLGYFGSIPLYIAGIVLLGRVVGVKYSLSKIHNLLGVFIVPALMLLISYYFFLRGYQFDFADPLKVFLDFGYPLGQAVYISIAILVFVLSRNVIGGVMRPKVLLLLLGFLVQYTADSNFLFQSINGTWVSGFYGDLLYFAAYFATTLGLISFFDPNLGRLAFVPIESPTQDVYGQIILKIIAEQQQVMGPVALEEASRIASIRISPDLKQVEILGSGRQALVDLVSQYERLFGKASLEVCRQAARGLIAQLPLSEIPEVLK